MNMQKLMQEAKKMQEKMQKAQEELKSMKVTGEAGGGLVKIETTGDYDSDSTHVIFSDHIEDECDAAMIQDLTTAALRDLFNKIKDKTRGKIENLTSGFNLPGALGGNE